MAGMSNHVNATDLTTDLTTDRATASPVALITGGSAGLGRELVHALAARGWTVVTDGRDPDRLREATAGLPTVHAVAGDVSDAQHRASLVERVTALGRLDLLLHNASDLGPTPLRPLRDLALEELRAVWAVNVGPGLDLTRPLLPLLKANDGVLASISSDAAVEHYPTWGGYGASKAALDHLVLTWGEEERVRAYAIDPGDMRTAMHQAAFPDEDISDRPLPATVVPHLLAILDRRPPSGRLRAADFAAAQVTS